MKINYGKNARKQLRSLNPKTANHILNKIEDYANHPATQTNNVRPLKGKEGYRLRVGDYRMLFTIQEGTVHIMWVFRIGHRKDVYDG